VVSSTVAQLACAQLTLAQLTTNTSSSRRYRLSTAQLWAHNLAVGDLVSGFYGAIGSPWVQTPRHGDPIASHKGVVQLWAHNLAVGDLVTRTLALTEILVTSPSAVGSVLTTRGVRPHPAGGGGFTRLRPGPCHAAYGCAIGSPWVQTSRHGDPIVPPYSLPPYSLPPHSLTSLTQPPPTPRVHHVLRLGTASAPAHAAAADSAVDPPPTHAVHAPAAPLRQL
jgi:hypothetical protein